MWQAAGATFLCGSRKVFDKERLATMPLFAPIGEVVLTALTKPVTRRTENEIRYGSKRRPLVITLYPGGTIGLRPSKTRREELLSVEAAYALAIKQRVAKEKTEKKARKK